MGVLTWYVSRDSAAESPAHLRVTHLENTHADRDEPWRPGRDRLGRHRMKNVCAALRARRVGSVLYACDATNLKLLWKSPPGELAATGKYNEPTVLDRAAHLGTDRIQAFGLRPQAGR